MALKSIVSLALLLCVLFSAVSCKSSAGEDKETALAKEKAATTIFRAHYVDFPEGATPYIFTPVKNESGRLSFTCCKDGSDGYFLYTTDINGENGSLEVGGPSIREGGSVRNTIQYKGGTLNVEYYYGGDKGERIDASLIMADADGKIVFEADIEEIFNISLENQPADPSGEHGFYIKALVGTDSRKGTEDYICVSSRDTIAVLRSDLSYHGSIKIPTGEVQSMCLTGSGEILIKYGKDKNWAVKPVDAAALKLGEKIKLPTGFESADIYIGEGYDLYLGTKDGLFGYKKGGEPELLIDWAASDLVYYNIYQLTVISPDRYAVLTNDYIFNQDSGAVLTPVPPDVEPKQTVTIAYVECDFDLPAIIAHFNRTNDKYRVVAKDYGKYNLEDDPSRGLTYLEADMAAGNMPDMLVMSGVYTAGVYAAYNYASKGMLADLYSFADDEFSPDELVGCCRYPFEKDGKLFFIPMAYTIVGYFGKSSNFEDKNWTVGTALEYLKDLPDNQRLIDWNLTEYLFNLGLDEFVDYEKAECSFDGGLFAEILEYIKNAPNKSQPGEDTGRRSTLYRDDAILLYSTSVINVGDWVRLRRLFNDDRVANIGYPSKSGGAAVIETHISYAITAGGDRAGAWEFLKYRLSDDIQYKKYSPQLPVTKKPLEKMLKESLERNYYFFDDGGSVTYTGELTEEVTSGRKGVGIEPTESDYNAVVDFIDNARPPYDRDGMIMNIIYEETAPFLYQGKGIAADCAKKIQSRVSIYLSEHS